MKVRFWGVRGSIPTPPAPAEVHAKIRKAVMTAVECGITEPKEVDPFLNSLPEWDREGIGGNTSCVEVMTDDPKIAIVFDCGSGLKRLGNELMKGPHGKGEGEVHLFISHTHWDHIVGIPFFGPLFVPGNKIHFYGVHDAIESRLRYQQEFRFFPVPLDGMAAEKIFHQLDAGESVTIAGTKVSVNDRSFHHPGNSWGFKAQRNGCSVVYATDAEFKKPEPNMMGFAQAWLKDVDLLIFDSQYTFAEAMDKRDWGHCSSLIGVDLCVAHDVRILAIFHHEPNYDDEKIVELLNKTVDYRDKLHTPGGLPEVIISREGAVVDLARKGTAAGGART
jgi:phosphoribosyl 1,2-cyclic phosphodiesterase